MRSVQAGFTEKRSVHCGEVEVEGYVDVGTGVVGWEGGEFVNAEEGSGGGIVHRTITTRGVEAYVFNCAVAIDAKGNDGMSAAGGGDGWSNCILQPGFGAGAPHGFDVPKV